MFFKEKVIILLKRGIPINRNLLIQRCVLIVVLLILPESIVFTSTAQVGIMSTFPPTRGQWLYVGGTGPGNYTTIQDAIDDASEGDTVFVYHGTYVGYVVINKAISLLGEEKNTTCIMGYFAYTVSIVADGVTMSGFTIQNQGYRGEGLRIDSSSNTFTNNKIDMPNDRIRIAGDYNTFSRNNITNCYVYLSGENNTISENSITNTEYGLYLMDAWDNIISDNSFFSSGLFISLENVCKNDVRNNTVNAKPLFYIEDESDVILDTDAGQIILVHCNNITVQNQKIGDTSIGIQIFESSACMILGNTIVGNQYGIYLSGWNNTIQGNTITLNDFAIYLSGENTNISDNIILDNDVCLYLILSDHNTLLNNIMTNNSMSILLDFGCEFNNIINNTITHSGQGIRVAGGNNIISRNHITCDEDALGASVTGDKNFLSGNTITYNEIGILLVGNDNIVSGNTITDNEEGIYLIYSDFNTIINNTISHNNQNGINLASNDCNNSISGNSLIWNNWSAIYLNCSDRNVLSGNSISHNEQGINLVSSPYNTILKNNFLRNKQHGLFENCTNFWSKNYWGRPRIFPKLIAGTIERDSKEFLWFDIDWRPAFRSYDFPCFS